MTSTAPARTADALAPVYALSLPVEYRSGTSPSGRAHAGFGLAVHAEVVTDADGLRWPAGGERGARVALPTCGHVDPTSGTAAVWRAEFTCAVCDCAARGILLPYGRFEADPADGGQETVARCHGSNHGHHLRVGQCSACRVPVARNERGNLVAVIHTGSWNARKAVCWQVHQCNPYLVAEIARHAADSFAQATAEGRMVKGSTVRVYKGRKVKPGTVGVVRWIGEAFSGGERFGLSVDGLDALVYVDAAHCEPA